MHLDLTKGMEAQHIEYVSQKYVVDYNIVMLYTQPFASSFHFSFFFSIQSLNHSLLSLINQPYLLPQYAHPYSSSLLSTLLSTLSPLSPLSAVSLSYLLSLSPISPLSPLSTISPLSPLSTLFSTFPSLPSFSSCYILINYIISLNRCLYSYGIILIHNFLFTFKSQNA